MKVACKGNESWYNIVSISIIYVAESSFRSSSEETVIAKLARPRKF